MTTALLARRRHGDEEELEDWTRALVEEDKRIFAIGVAFEPRPFIGKRVYDDYCLYVYEHPDGLSTKQLLPPLYPPPFYRERDWYTVPKTTGQPWWSEPHMGQRGGNTPMLTYSVPFYRDGKFGGVVTADLSIPYFKEMHNRLRQQYLGPDSYSFVISPSGTFVYHPNPRYEFPAPTSSLDRIEVTPDFLAMMQKMRQKDAGRARATHFDSGRPAAFFFARIPATGGHFVSVQLGDVAEELDDLADR